MQLINTANLKQKLIDTINNKNNEICKQCWAKRICRRCVAQDIKCGNILVTENCIHKRLYEFALYQLVKLYDKNINLFQKIFTTYYSNIWI